MITLPPLWWLCTVSFKWNGTDDIVPCHHDLATATKATMSTTTKVLVAVMVRVGQQSPATPRSLPPAFCHSKIVDTRSNVNHAQDLTRSITKGKLNLHKSALRVRAPAVMSAVVIAATLSLLFSLSVREMSINTMGHGLLHIITLLTSTSFFSCSTWDTAVLSRHKWGHIDKPKLHYTSFCVQTSYVKHHFYTQFNRGVFVEWF